MAALVVTGAGGHFCAGADIAEFEAAYRDAPAIAATNAAIRDGVEALAHFPKPAIAAIRGACVGGGVALALACDLRFAAEDARFAVTPARLGLIYSHGDTLRLVRAVGVGARRRHAALRPHGGGGGSGADRPGAAPRRARGAARRPVADTSRALPPCRGRHCATSSACWARSPPARWRRRRSSPRSLPSGFEGEDFREGYAAFVEKRPPRFRAR